MTAGSQHKRSIDRVASMAIVLLITAGLVFLITPLLVTGLLAFDARDYLGPMPPPALSLHWFQRLFSQDYVLAGARTSFEIAALTTAINVIIGTVTALGIDRREFPGRNLLLTAFLSPLVVPAVVTGFALLLYLSKLGIVTGFPRLLCGHVIITLPYAIRTTLASLAGRDKRLTDAAQVLGATELEAFWSVTLPLIRTGIVTGAVFTFAISLDDIAVSLFLNDPSTFTLPVALVSNMRASFDLTIAAAAVLLVAATGILILILERTVGFDRLIGQGLFRS